MKPSIFEEASCQFSGVFAFVFFAPRAKQPDLPAYLYLGDREVIQLAVRLFSKRREEFKKGSNQKKEMTATCWRSSNQQVDVFQMFFLKPYFSNVFSL